MLTHIQKRKAVELFKITFFQLSFCHFEGVWIKDIKWSMAGPPPPSPYTIHLESVLVS